MEIKCRINGVDYDAKLEQGHTFSEDYGEVLDSATITIDRVHVLKDLKPYDDVWLYDSNTTFPNKVNYSNPPLYIPFHLVNYETYYDSAYILGQGMRYYYYARIYFLQNDYNNLINATFDGAIFEDFNAGMVGLQDVAFSLEVVGNNLYLKSQNETEQIKRFVYDSTHNYYYVDTKMTIFGNNSSSISLSAIYNYCLPLNLINSETAQGFYKHFLVDQFSEEIKNLEEGIYSYTIQLFSETKGLEVVACPNLSVTEPLMFDKKITIYQYIAQFIYLYSPLIKIEDPFHSGKWIYQRKYRISEEVKEKFDKVYCQDFTLTNPTLRELLTELFKTLDLIPVVKDNVIYSYDKTARVGWFHNCRGSNFPDKGPLDYTELKQYVNRITGSLSSSNYTDNLRRNHQNALAQYKSASTVEYIGFRNRNNALLTLEGLKLETAFPIYKVDSCLMCYYKIGLYSNGTNVIYRPVLIKQDITKLIKLESERNLLSQDWYDFNGKKIGSIDDLAKYKLCTLGYNIGSNQINGFGTTYTYPVATWDIKATYIENIFKYMNTLFPFGCVDSTELYTKFSSQGYSFIGFDENNVSIPFSCVAQYGVDLDANNVIPDPPENEDVNGVVEDSRYNLTACLKSLFFEVDYQPFYSGSVVASKDGGRDAITHIDNTTSALALLEKDGIAQKEKINALANKTYVFTARYTDLSQIQPLGTVFESEDESDIIIYHKEFSCYDNVINCTYLGAKDYVLKQFFTSVYAKHRPNKLMDYSESVNRAENKKLSIVLSKNKLYYEKPNNFDMSFLDFGITSPTEKILDVFRDSDGVLNYQTMQMESSSKINYGLFVYKGNLYAFDINTFICGKSLCFNLSMIDNASAGVYISNLIPGTSILNEDYRNLMKSFYKDNEGIPKTTNWFFSAIQDRGAYKGSLQKWYLTADEDTGNGEIYNFIFAHRIEDAYIPKFIDGNSTSAYTKNDEKIKATQYIEKTLKFPKMLESNIEDLNYKISVPILFKDNKDLLNLTTQFEVINEYNSDIYFSSFMCALSDLMGIYYRNNNEYIKINNPIGSLQICYNTIYEQATDSQGHSPSIDLTVRYPDITIKLSSEVLAYLKNLSEHRISEVTEEYYQINSMGMAMVFPSIQLPDFVWYKSDVSGDVKYLCGSDAVAEEDFVNGGYFIPEKIEFLNYSSGSVVLKGRAEIYSWDYKDPGLDSEKGWYFTRHTYSDLQFNFIVTEGDYSDHLENGKYVPTENNLLTLKTLKEDSTNLQPIFNTSGVGLYTKYSFVNTYIGGIAPTTNKMWISEKVSFDNSEPEYDDEDYDNYTLNFSSIPINTPSITIQPTMVLTYSSNSINQNVEYMEIKFKQETNSFIDTDFVFLEDVKVSDVFSTNANGIEVNLSALSQEEYYSQIKSLQYWYYDSQSESYKFVFGINLSDSDKEQNTIQIYASLVRNKDTRVFDANNQIVGHIKNWAGSGSTPTDQLYE